MVEKFRKMLEKIKADKGEVSMFALAQMDEPTGQWTLVLSAPWAKENDPAIFKYVLDEMKAALSAEELATMARIAIFSKNEHFIELLLRYNSGVVIKNERINGNYIQEGYILESKA